MVRAVLAQDLEDVQKANRPDQGGGRKRPLTPTQLIRDLVDSENGLVSGILDIPLQIISAGSAALTTGLLLWDKNRTLLLALLGVSALSYRGVRMVRCVPREVVVVVWR